MPSSRLPVIRGVLAVSTVSVSVAVTVPGWGASDPVGWGGGRVVVPLWVFQRTQSRFKLVATLLSKKRLRRQKECTWVKQMRYTLVLVTVWTWCLVVVTVTVESVVERR
jgi:hypothetical protein